MGKLGEADADAVLEDLEAIGGAVRVKIGNCEVIGARNDSDDPVLDQDEVPVHARLVGVAIRTGSLTGLAIGAALTVDGEDFKVADFRAVGNGTMTRLSLAKTGKG